MGKDEVLAKNRLVGFEPPGESKVRPCVQIRVAPLAANTYEIDKYIPLDKSWIIRLGVLDMLNGYRDISKFLGEQLILSDDLKALARCARDWDAKKPIDVGESGTLYRCLQFASWKYRLDKKFIKQGTLNKRELCDNPEIIKWPLEKLLILDGGTSQWATASVLAGSTERPATDRYKLRLTYEAVGHWNDCRDEGVLWSPRVDETIKRQALAYFGLIKTGKLFFLAKDAEDYCYARAFGLMRPEEGERAWPQLVKHESNRIQHMEEVIDMADNGRVIHSLDHRAVQAIVMRQKSRNLPVEVVNKDVVNKSWPEFWDFLEYANKVISPSN